jgi:APA family basic amino acid/polyamine antiporter
MSGTTSSEPSQRRLGLTTATLIVVASMVGTGVFTTTGFLVRDIASSPAVLLAWMVGGVFALCGALSYAELVAALPRSGGEYHLLSRAFHPAVGFVAGWISLVVGFSAPIAASALAFGSYTAAIAPMINPIGAALTLVIALTAIHALHVTAGSGVQNLFAAIKVVLILVLIAGGGLLGKPEHIFAPTSTSLLTATLSPAFAVGLIFISFAYSGWNGAAYIAGEVRSPARTLPVALLSGTAVVTILYLGVNYVFLTAAPASELSGVVEIGHVAATHLFGAGTGKLLSAVIALALVSSVSAQIMAGPRVYQVMGEDHPRLRLLARRTRHGAPVVAVILQSAVATLMLVTSTFEALLTYIGFTLSLSAGLTVVGVAVLRRREPGLERPYRAWGYPLTPGLFVVLCLWMTVHALWQRPVVAIAGLVTIASGLGLFFVVRTDSADR